MLKRLMMGLVMTGTMAVAQSPSVQYEVANLREDVRGLVQRVGELNLRVEQLERENSDLRGKASAAAQSNVSVEQLNEAVADLNRTIKAAAGSTKNETLQQVAVQMEKLAKQTNAAIDSLAKGMAARPAVQTTFTEDYAKEGTSYTVQKGDTLSSIAQKTNARITDIVNANKISDPTRIQVGQTLFIPAAK
ncbi:MAG: LysM peptidoglycan-binding domain-containing protein [Verrucomicrobia bacterium]|nr:LysM peptidoglycan-binding domain-containing protein [Verrucomicrobiota bacterium]